MLVGPHGVPVDIAQSRILILPALKVMHFGFK